MREVVRIDGVDNVEEELTVWCLVLKELIRHVFSYVNIVLNHADHPFHRELLDAWHCNKRDLAQLKDFLLAYQEKLEEVFVYLRLWW